MISSTMMLALMGTMWLMPAAPSGINKVSAASGPYAAELSASKPKIGIPALTPISSALASSEASGRPRRMSTIDMAGLSYGVGNLPNFVLKELFRRFIQLQDLNHIVHNSQFVFRRLQALIWNDARRGRRSRR